MTGDYESCQCLYAAASVIGCFEADGEVDPKRVLHRAICMRTQAIHEARRVFGKIRSFPPERRAEVQAHVYDTLVIHQSKSFRQILVFDFNEFRHKNLIVWRVSKKGRLEPKLLLTAPGEPVHALALLVYNNHMRAIRPRDPQLLQKLADQMQADGWGTLERLRPDNICWRGLPTVRTWSSHSGGRRVNTKI